ncbi:uncharacterized protein B0I36DRAFT_54283 [Microdochium trichocladiopsis]|uniref:Uncharacterized protein n=1 Tax=Microdochium trichocladiopsis TaxID=1682393 RepID=A0A9P9BIE6_9PEZI|nr:uncharacterized protein B0I36DRAFT_54283 [Microdochium trichocladiopsis]KAH7012077.1 hypothetical protein B0I36DRAFT_54283 [Microdochium trichocladiopsis]
MSSEVPIRSFLDTTRAGSARGAAHSSTERQSRDTATNVIAGDLSKTQRTGNHRGISLRLASRRIRLYGFTRLGVEPGLFSKFWPKNALASHSGATYCAPGVKSLRGLQGNLVSQPFQLPRGLTSLTPTQKLPITGSRPATHRACLYSSDSPSHRKLAQN